jgi:NAD(P)-dependent dehydrogenase (short-subunit alcohol dehydrogenase family)
MIGPTLFRLDGRIAAIIGAGSGIGDAVARGFASHGAHASCLDINANAAAAVAEKIQADGGSSDAASIDVRSGAAVADAFARIVPAHARLDIVVCTPAINIRKPLVAYTDEEFDRVVAVNLKGSFNVLREAGRVMTAQQRGSIVIFSSIRAQVVEPGQSVYAATKAGIVQMVRTAAAEFGPSGVRVNAVGPGVVETPLTAPIKAARDWYDAYAAKSVFKRWATADEMVGPTLFLASDAASYVTGTLLLADGGWTAVDGRFTPPGMAT